MESGSISSLLRVTREENNINLAQASQDTHISVHFLEALENERFDVFDSETYLIGFLKTYANYLSLDGQKLVEHYRNLKVQEQPTPIEELLTKNPVRVFPIVALSVAGVAVILLAIWFFVVQYPTIQLARRQDDTFSADNEAAADRRTYYLENGFLERSFIVGDAILFNVDDREFTARIIRIGRSITIGINEQSESLRLGEERGFDVTLDGTADVEVFVRDVIRDGASRAVIRFVTVTPDQADDPQPAAADAPDRYGTTTVASRRLSATTIGPFADLFQIALNVRFTSSVYFQYRIDNQDTRVSALYNPNDVLTIMAENRLAIWTTNAGGVVMSIADTPIPLGAPGQVKAMVIEKDIANADANTTSIRLAPLY